MRASFGVTFSDPNNIRLKPDVGGGALLDAGSYAVSLIRLAAGERPIRATAFSTMFDTGVDKTTVATLEFASGIIAQMSCSFSTAYHRHAMVHGDGGTLESTYLNHPPIGGPPVLSIRRGATVATTLETIETPGGNGFLLEAESFARMVRGGASNWNGATPEESVDIALTLEAIAASAKSGKPVAIGA